MVISWLRSDASDLAAIRGTTLAPLEPRKEWSPDAKALLDQQCVESRQCGS